MYRQLPQVAWPGCLLLTSCVPLFTTAPPNPTDIDIGASVTSVDATTGIPQTLSGTISGDLTGTYSENVLDLFFDADGNLTGALSVSQFTFDAPFEGTLASTNFITVTGPILLTDETGNPVLDESESPTVIGLETASTGDLLSGTGAFESAFGTLQTDSDLFFTGGDSDMGAATVALQMFFTFGAPTASLLTASP